MSEAKTLAEFKSYLEHEEKSVNTITAYLKSIQDFVSFHGTADSLSQLDINEWIRQMRDRKLSAATIKIRLQALKSWCNFTDINDNLSFHLEDESVYHSPVLTDEIVSSYLARVDGQAGLRDRTIIHLMANAGLRQSEICNLQMSSLAALQYNQLLIPSSFGQARIIPVSDSLKSILYTWIEHQKNNQRKSNYLFLTHDGNQISSKLIYFITRKYIDTETQQKLISPRTLRKHWLDQQNK